MSFFLVSFPNQVTSAMRSLIAIDISREQARWVRLENHVPDVGGGVCGVCRIPGGVAICTQSVSPYIVLLRSTQLEVVHVHALKAVRDAHSIIFYDGHLYVVSTGTNEIYRLKVEDFRVDGEELFWRYPGTSSHSDDVHLNGITVSNSRLIATAFGHRKDEKWAGNGSVFYPETGEVIAEGLDQPHTPICSEDALFFAESSPGAVHVYKRNAEGQWIHEGRIPTGGYARGIAFSNAKLYIGISSLRNVSKSQGIMLAEQELSSRAGIMCLNLPELSPESTFDLSPFTREIYDILPLESGIALDSSFAALSERAREMQNSGERSADQVSRLGTNLNKVNREQQQLISAQRQLETVNQRLETENQRLEAEKQALTAEKERLGEELGVILSSHSWRFTAPMRRFKSKCQQFLGARSCF
jgi:hypothetical protein